MTTDVRTLMGAISRAIGHIDENEIGDEASVERARAELWAVYDPELDPEEDAADDGTCRTCRGGSGDGDLRCPTCKGSGVELTREPEL